MSILEDIASMADEVRAAPVARRVYVSQALYSEIKLLPSRPVITAEGLAAAFLGVPVEPLGDKA